MNKTKIKKNIHVEKFQMKKEKMLNLQMLENTNHFQVHYYILPIKSRPDITYAVNQASRNCEHPTTIDYKALLLILQYLKSTINKSIYYNGKNRLVGFFRC